MKVPSQTECLRYHYDKHMRLEFQIKDIGIK